MVPGKQALVLDDWDEIITAVIDLWENPERARALASKARAMAQSLDWDAIAAQYQSIYARLA